MRRDVGDLRQCQANGLLDLVGQRVRRVERHVAGDLEVERHLGLPARPDHADVVDLTYTRHRQRSGQHPVVDAVGRPPRLHVHHHVAAGDRREHRRLDRIGGGVALRERGGRRDRDHDVREMPAGGMAHAEAVEADRRREGLDRRPGGPLGPIRRAIHQDVGVRLREASRGDEHQDRHEEGGQRVGLGVSGSGQQQSHQHRDRAGEIAGEVHRVCQERGTPVAAGGAQRHERPGDVDGDHDPDDRKGVPRRVDLDGGFVRQAPDGLDCDVDAHGTEDRPLGQRREMLGLAVPPGVGGVGRSPGDADGEERQQRRDQVGTGVDGLGDQPEAVGGEPGGELERDEAAGGDHRDECGASCGRHHRECSHVVRGYSYCRARITNLHERHTLRASGDSADARTGAPSRCDDGS